MPKKMRRIVFLWGLLPFTFLLFCYYMVARIACRFIYQAPLPEPWTLAKMVPSLIFDKLNFHFFYFDWPAEYADYIASALTAAGKPFLPYAAYSFHHFPDGFACGWIYNAFPFFVLFALVVSVVLVVRRAFSDPTENMKDQKHIRGTVRLDPDKFVRKNHKVVKDPVISIPTTTGDLRLSSRRMAEHFLILGATGTGKSQLLFNIISALNGRKRMILIDRKGEFWSHFSRPGDTLFHPFDTRSVHWNLFNDLQFPAGEARKMPDDIVCFSDIICKAIEERQGLDPMWNRGASAVLSSAIALMCLRGTTTMESLYLFFKTGYQNIVADFQTLPLPLNDGLMALSVEKTALSIILTLTTHIKQLTVFFDREGDWSIRDWINNGEGNLYISIAGKNDTSFLMIISFMIDLIAREIKEFKEVHNTNLVFILDEFGALPAIPSISFLLTQARSKGVSMVIANQSFARIKKTYGADDARDIFLNCKSRFIFSIPEPVDADFISKSFGDAEVLRSNAGTNASTGTLLSTGSNRQGVSESQQVTLDRSILPSTLINLPTGSAAVRLPDMVPFVSVLQFKQLQTQEPIAEEYLPVVEKMISAHDVATNRPLTADPAPSPEAATVPEPASTDGESDEFLV